MVRMRGLEPPRAYAHLALNQARLPFRHIRMWSLVSMVRSGGVEPPRAFAHQPLKLARLPFRHDRMFG